MAWRVEPVPAAERELDRINTQTTRCVLASCMAASHNSTIRAASAKPSRARSWGTLGVLGRGITEHCQHRGRRPVHPRGKDWQPARGLLPEMLDQRRCLAAAVLVLSAAGAEQGPVKEVPTPEHLSSPAGPGNPGPQGRPVVDVPAHERSSTRAAGAGRRSRCASDCCRRSHRRRCHELRVCGAPHAHEESCFRPGGQIRETGIVA